MSEVINLVIVNYNSTDYTIRCIDSINQSASSYRLQIIVVDNASNDSPGRIKKKHPKVDLIINKRNVGFATAVNLGIKKSDSETLILLKPDTIVWNGLFDRIISYLHDNKDVAIVGPKILERNGAVQGSARRFPNILSSFFGRKSPITRIFPNNPVTKREFVCFNQNGDCPLEVDWVSGACMVARKTALKSVGGFDENFFLYWEDADLCKRLKNAGWKIMYYPKAEIYHHTGSSSNTALFHSIFHFHKSCYLLFKKNAGLLLKIIMPFPLLGLGMRCLFVIGLNGIQRKLNRENKKLSQIKKRKNANNILNSKIKILRVVSRLNIGGPSIHCSILLRGLNNERFMSKLVTGSLSPDEGDMRYIVKGENGFLLNVPEMQREIYLPKDLKAFLKILQLCFKEKPDIVHTHMAKAGAVTRIAVWIHNFVSKKKIKTVHTYHGHVLIGYFSPIKSNFFNFIEKILAKITDVIIAISRTQRWELSEKFKIAKKDKIITINLGFDLSPFTNADKGKLRSLIGVGNNVLLIGIVGRLVPIKNHLLFLDSAKLIKAKHPDKQIRFLIIGDGELRDHLKKYAYKLGIEKDVIFTGWQHDLSIIYSDLDIVALTSLNEGTPVSIIEAMASSVPVITTGVGGVKDLLGRIIQPQNKNDKFKVCERGLFCKGNDPSAFADGLDFIINKSLYKGTDRIVRAREFVLENYSDKKLIRKIEAIYYQLLRI